MSGERDMGYRGKDKGGLKGEGLRRWEKIES